MTRVLFLIRSLGNGGAERQLAELVRMIDQSRFDVTAATFYAGGARWADVERVEGVRLVSLDKGGRWDVIRFLPRALRLARQLRPDVINGFAQEPNLVALLLGRMTKAKVAWTILRSSKELPRGDRLAMANYRLGARLSYRADAVVYNSHRGRDIYVGRGYCASNATVISNGFDTTRFRPNEEARARKRTEWGVAPSEFLIGIAGRLNPVKDHPLFLRAAADFVRTHPSSRFVCIGGGPDGYLGELRALAAELGIGDRVIWASEVLDMAAAYNALDLLALCSKEEGCPNVVGEAMACGVPCVVTDVGDAARLVAETGLVVTQGDHVAMASAWRTMAEVGPVSRSQTGAAARERMVSEFPISLNVARTSALLEGLAR